MDRIERDRSEEGSETQKEKSTGLSSLGEVVKRRNELVRVFADDQLFSKCGHIANDLNLSPHCAKNFGRLAQGYRGFPLLLLLNPCGRHAEEFGDMFTENSALFWLKQLFNEIRLSLEHEVPILDMFPFLSDNWLREKLHNGQQAEIRQLILQACDMTQEILELLNPPAIVVMHCATNPRAVQRHPFFGQVQHPLAQALSSSMAEAERGQCHTFTLCGREVQAISAFHPSRIHYENDFEEKRRLTKILREILSNVFLPWVPNCEENTEE